MSDIKQEKGITMLALILMIIIMLILAKASVSIITGADGMVDNTKSTIDLAKQESLNEQIREEIKQEEIKAKLLGQELSGETITNIINSHGGEYDYKVKINLDSQGATETGTTEIFENYNKNFVIYKDNQYNVMTYVTYRIEFPEKYDTDGSNMIFMGYYTEPEGQGVQYINEDGYLNQEAADTKHFIREGTLYAYWIRVPAENIEKIIIKYDANGGVGTMTDSIFKVNDSYEFKLKENTYKKMGYLFYCWKDQNGKSYNNGETITTTEDLVLTAQWKTISESLGYVTDNLILHYDGIINSLDGTHHYDYTSWQDLSLTENTGSIMGGSFTGNSLLLNANSKQYVLVSNPNSIPTGSQNYTIEITFEHDGSAASGGLVNLGIFNTQNKSNALRLFNTTGLRHYYWGADLDAQTGNVNSNVIYTVVAVNRGADRKIYVNNSIKANDNKTPNTTLGNVTIGKTYEGEYFSGKIYSVRIYSRGLTDYELKQNYNIDINRFMNGN